VSRPRPLSSSASVERVRLRSNAVASAGYDAATRELELEFSSGHVYRYAGVAPAVFEWLLRVENKGGFVRRMIQGQYLESAQGREGQAAAGGGGSLEDALRASLDRLSKPPA
jgi:KTSC domain-containing protein